MIKFDVLNRFTGDVHFTAEIECDENEPLSFKLGLSANQAIKNGADLRNADLRDADLSGADLRNADLSDADLSGADLRNADLRNADLRGARGVLKLPVSDMRYMDWIAVWFGDQWMVKAGCRWFTIQESRDHWLSDNYKGPQSVKDTVPFALDWLEQQEKPHDQ